MKARSWLVLVAALGCQELTIERPVAPAEPPPAEPARDTGCSDACANLARLGGCEMMPRSMTCEAACERMNSGVDDTGKPILALDTACLSAAKTCDAANRCD